jgi:hypothetical protein
MYTYVQFTLFLFDEYLTCVHNYSIHWKSYLFRTETLHLYPCRCAVVRIFLLLRMYS